MQFDFVTGNYCSENEPSLDVFSFQTDPVRFVKLSSFTGLKNPSYVLYDRDRSLLYAVEELTPEGNLCVLKKDGNRFSKMMSISTRGADPCQISMDDQKEFLFVANYSSGSLAVYRLDGQGMPALTDFVQHHGSGPDKERQEQAHVHFSRWSDGKLYVCDLGMDRIFCYQLDRPSGRLLEEASLSIQMPQGAGPRHLLFSEKKPGIMYCIGELANKVYVLKKNDPEGKYELIQSVSTLPSSFEGLSQAAAIKSNDDESFILASNRGYDSISVFRTDADGLLSEEAQISAVPEFPRDFSVVGNYVITGSQHKNDLFVYELNSETGTLSYTNIMQTSLRPVLIERLV